MNGKQLRRWAWNRAGEQWKTLLPAWLITLLAALPVMLANRLLRTTSWPLRELIPFPLQFFNTFVQLGWIFVVLKVAQGERAEYRQVAAPFRREWRRKALAVTLASLLLAGLVQLVPNLLIWRGQAGMTASGYQEYRLAEGLVRSEEGLAAYQLYRRGSALVSLGSGLGTVLGLLWSGVWFPVSYLLFLSPEKGAGQVLREGMALGLRSLWRILVFQFWLLLPLVLPVFLVLLAAVSEAGWAVALLVVLWMGLLVCVTPYVGLAQAGLALGLLGKSPRGSGKKRRK